LSSALLTGAAASRLIRAVFRGLLIYLLVWVRVTLPRCRYDKLMLMCWSVVLPIAIFMLFVVLVLVS
jgi:NADH-ubiquinone oxidoreductase chain 1